MTIPLYSRSSDIRNLALGSGCEAASVLSWLYQDELPDTVWFQLGTACHEAIEECILEDLTLDEMVASGLMNLKIAQAEATTGTIESASTRSKRSLETAPDDLVRMLTKWYHSVHPNGDHRAKIFNQYQWPPKVEHEIMLHKTDETALYTTVDAIFAGNDTCPFGEETLIVDWKTGSTSKASPSQLQVYAYGGRKEGWFSDNQIVVGLFWHLDHDKAQYVDTYIGDSVVEQWIARTYTNKLDVVASLAPTYVPDWWCPYCQSRDICPVNNPKTGKNHKEIGIAINNATLLTEPDREER